MSDTVTVSSEGSTADATFEKESGNLVRCSIYAPSVPVI